MIIRQYQDVIDRRKTQTRRLINPEKTRLVDDYDYKYYHTSLTGRDENIVALHTLNKHLNWQVKWRVGKVYAMMPKMGKPGVGFYRITSLRVERLQDISEQDAIAEGIYKTPRSNYTCYGMRGVVYPTPIDCYRALWESMGTPWNDDQYVAVIGIEYVGKVRP